jgi:membrane protein implicated in regulation of membrane protease activity
LASRLREFAELASKRLIKKKNIIPESGLLAVLPEAAVRDAPPVDGGRGSATSKLAYPCGRQPIGHRARTMSIEWTWWIGAAALIGAELLTGTFYLLAIGVAVALGGVAAWLGADLRVQFAVAGVLGVALTIAAHRWRLARASPPQQPALDIGQAVHVQTWNPDGTARVAYRGSTWDAELAGPQVPRAETLYIVAMHGSVLVLSDRKPGP